MQLVHKQNRRPAIGGQPIARLVERRAQFLDAGRSRVERDELAPCLAGDDLGQRCLSGARWTVEDRRRNAVGFEHPPQQFA
jgi:hypothetical protein